MAKNMFEKVKIKEQSKMYLWALWGSKIWIDEINYFKGIPINEKDIKPNEAEARDQFNNKWKKYIKILEHKGKSELDRYNWMICNELIDFKANIQWTKWYKMFWFYCIIKWLKSEKDTCPSWRNTITEKNINTNLNLGNDLKLMVSMWTKSKSIEWKHHQKYWDIYWQTWDWEVWYVCTINKMHKDHKLIAMEDKREAVLKSARKAIDANKLTNLLTAKEIKRINSNQILAKYIKDDIFNLYRQKIELVDQEISQSIIDFHNELTERIVANDEWKESEELLKKFVETKDLKRMNKSIEAIDNLEKRKQNIKIIVDEIKNSEMEPKIITSDSPLISTLIVDGDQIRKLDEENITIELQDDFITFKNKRIKISDSWIDLWLEENNPSSYYSMININENSLCNLKYNNSITKIKSNSEMYNLNDFIMLDKNDQTDKIELELCWWKVTNNVENFIKDTKNKISNQLQNSI